METCHCHSGLNYSFCCKKFHLGAMPGNALQLMRSRYCAYALGLVNYIIQTTHKNNSCYQKNTAVWKKELKTFCKETHFENLEILHFEEQGNLAYVSFIATLKQGSQDVSFTEKSSFKKEGKAWLYLGGESHPGRHENIE